MYLPNIAAMDNIMAAKLYFGVQQHAPVYYKIFYDLLLLQNNLGCHFCWPRLLEIEKDDFFDSFFMKCLDVTSDCNSTMFLFTIFER